MMTNANRAIICDIYDRTLFLMTDWSKEAGRLSASCALPVSERHQQLQLLKKRYAREIVRMATTPDYHYPSWLRDDEAE